MNWDSFKTFHNTIMIFVADSNVANLSYYQQLLFDEILIPPHSTAAETGHDNDLQILDDVEQLNWEPAEQLN